MTDADILKRWFLSPATFVREAIGVEPTNQQLQALEDIRCLVLSRLQVYKNVTPTMPEYAGKRGLSIMSGQGTGKDGFAAWLILWSLICLPRPKLLATAPVAHQLRSVLWAEVSKWLNRRGPDGEFACGLRNLITVQTEKIFLTETGGKESFCEGRTASPNDNADSQAETLAGRHEDFMIFLLDEASGIPDPVFRPIEGTLTGMCNFAVVIFNPTRRTGYALGTHYGTDKEFWVRRRWNAEESEIVSKDHLENMRKKYGPESNAYRVRVMGLPPTADDGALIPWDWALRATETDLEVPKDEPIVLGVDVGRQGDESVIAVRQGPEILQILRKQEPDVTRVASWILEVAAEWEPIDIYLDVIGLGWGVYDMVRQRSSVIRAVDVSRSPMRGDKYERLRDEMWMRVREVMERGLLKIPADDDLINELTSIRYETTAAGKVKVESKKEMKHRGLASPNRADAVAMTFALDARVSRLEAPEPEKKSRYQFKKKESRFSWMGA